MFRRTPANIIFLLAIILTTWMAYKGRVEDKGISPLPKTIKSFDFLPFENQMHIFKLDVNFSKKLASVWGLALPGSKRSKTDETNVIKGKVINSPTITQKGRTLCFKRKICYHLLGVFTKEKHRYATFYIQGERDPVVAVEENATLPKIRMLYLQSAKEDHVVIAEYNSTRSWNFGLFQVSEEKYKPKDHNLSSQLWTQ